MNIKSMKQSLVTAAVIGGVLAAAAAEHTITEDQDLYSGGRTITVQPGDVDYYTGVFSGAKRLDVNGTGTFVPMNSANAYTGICVPGGAVIRLDNAEAVNGWQFSLVNSTAADVRQIVFNDAGGVFNVTLSHGSSVSEGGAYSPFLFRKSGVLNGDVSFKATFHITAEPAGSDPVDVTFNGDLTSGKSGAQLVLNPVGRFLVNGKVTMLGTPYLRCDDASDGFGRGTVEFRNPANSIHTLCYGYHDIVLGAGNVITNAVLRHSSTAGYEEEGFGTITLKADQSIACLVSGSRANSRTGFITSTEPVTLTFAGGAAGTAVCQASVDGRVSLVMDGDDNAVQSFRSRTSLTTGSLSVRRGRLIIDGASFPNASGIDLSGNGALVVTNSVSPFTDGFLDSVSLSGSGGISSAVNAIELRTYALVVNGTAVTAEGTYTSADYPGLIGNNVSIRYRRAPRTFYVDAVNGDDLHDGQSAGTAMRTLASVMELAHLEGDVVYAAPGVYNAGSMSDGDDELARVIVGDGVTLRSSGGRASTFIVGDEGGNIRCARLGTGARLIGFTLADGYAAGKNGGGVNASGSTGSLVADCTVTNCHAQLAAAFFGGNVSVVRTLVTDCHVNNKKAYITSTANFWNCVFDGNGEPSQGYTLYNGKAVNCTLVNEYAAGHKADFYNCLVLDPVDRPGLTNQLFRTYTAADPGEANTTGDSCAVKTRGQIALRRSYVPAAGNQGIGRGNADYLTSAGGLGYPDNDPLGSGYDFYGGPRLTNGLLDLGAVASTGPAPGFCIMVK